MSYELSILVNGCETIVRGMGGFMESGESVREGIGGNREMKRRYRGWEGD